MRIGFFFVAKREVNRETLDMALRPFETDLDRLLVVIAVGMH